jgi:hypothetical protein
MVHLLHFLLNQSNDPGQYAVRAPVKGIRCSPISHSSPTFFLSLDVPHPCLGCRREWRWPSSSGGRRQMFLLAAANAHQRRYGNSNSADSVSLRQLGDLVVQSPVY